MTGREVLVVRASRHMQMPIRRELAGVLVELDVVGLDNPVAVVNLHIAIESVETACLRLEVRFDQRGGRIIVGGQHLRHGILRRFGPIRKA